MGPTTKVTRFFLSLFHSKEKCIYLYLELYIIDQSEAVFVVAYIYTKHLVVLFVMSGSNKGNIPGLNYTGHK